MKSLYININNEQIQSNEEIEVLNYDLDSDFFFYLGEKIAKDCKVENENALITNFNTQDNAEDYQIIIAQWHELKNILFSEKCEGEFKFTLPNGYVYWLRYSEKYNHVHDKNFSHGESHVISIDLEELYEESVEDMQRKVLRTLKRNDLYLEVDEIVFNDDAVTRKSPIVRTIKEKYEGIGFKAYKKWLERGEVVENQLPEEKEPKIGSSFLYLIRKEHGVFKVLDKEGRVVEPFETILVVDYRFNAYLQYNMPPYLLGLNTADDKLYFISPKQILCIGDWYNGKLYTSYELWENPQLGKYSICSNLYEKEVILQDDFKTFCIKDKFDYTTYYSVESGVCKCLSEGNITRKSELPYEIDDSEDIPISVSTITGEKIIIPGFRANIYLGNYNGVDIFWATKNCVRGQHRFKESFIVDIDGNIIRNYGYNHALTIGGKYILNVSTRGAESISTLNGNEIIKIKFDTSDLNGFSSEIEPNIFKFSGIHGDSDSWFWLVKEKAFCREYNKDFYVVPNKNGDDCLYRRTDNYLIGIIQPSNVDGAGLPDDIYYAEFKDNFANGLFFKSNGDTIYKLNDNEFPCMAEYKVCGVAENRIVINVDNRFYKILDYNSCEIARIDFNGIADCYNCGKLYYYNETELGYYDYDGVKHLINYQTRKRIKGIRIISSNLLLIKHNNKDVIVDLNGNVIIEAQRITPEPFFNRYINVMDKNYNSFICDASCNMLFQLDSGDSVLILE